jgi:hypothetical protein
MAALCQELLTEPFETIGTVLSRAGKKRTGRPA